MRTVVKRRVLAAAVAVALVATIAVVWRAMMRTEPLEVAEPTTSQLQSLAGAAVFFGHQSVGANVLGGLAALDGFADSGIRIVESMDAGALADSSDPAGTSADDSADTSVAAAGIAHAYLGVNGDPQSKIDAFVEVMDAGMADAVDVALLKFCYVDVTAGTDVRGLVAAYTDTIAVLQTRYPDVTFLYATVPLTTARDLKATVKSWLGGDAGMGPEDNVAREQFNAALREQFADSGVLFDIAAVEAGMDQSVAPRSQGGHDYYVLADGFAADPGHLNEAGSRAAAAELVRTIDAVLEQR